MLGWHRISNKGQCNPKHATSIYINCAKRKTHTHTHTVLLQPGQTTSLSQSSYFSYLSFCCCSWQCYPFEILSWLLILYWYFPPTCLTLFHAVPTQVIVKTFSTALQRGVILRSERQDEVPPFYSVLLVCLFHQSLTLQCFSTMNRHGSIFRSLSN